MKDRIQLEFVVLHTFVFACITVGIPVTGQPLITPIPRHASFDRAKAHLGRKLFSDPLLSSDSTVSCESCHVLDQGGVDHLKFSLGVEGRLGKVNSPTVFNSSRNFSQFWDGRAADLKEQARGPLTTHFEMNETLPNIVKKLKHTLEYPPLFLSIYPEGITEDTIIDAIVEFEKALGTPNSRFDKYLRGDKNALTEKEISGYELFNSLGCIACHNGVLIGGNMYQKFGIMKEYDDPTNHPGRYRVTGRKEDREVFKVPMLRNIELTAPYFHNGRASDLDKAVDTMVEYQLGIDISKEEKSQLVAFLRTLTGEQPAFLTEDKQK
jgi:cytochrome c peroxidase